MILGQFAKTPFSHNRQEPISLQSEPRLDTASADLQELGCGWSLCDGVQGNVAMFWDQLRAGKAKQGGKGARPPAREEYRRRPQHSVREAYGKMMRRGTPVHRAAGNRDRTTKASSRLVWAMLRPCLKKQNQNNPNTWEAEAGWTL